jgi:predicted RNase H-like nuclease (RuvC/YqgF family)
MKGILQAMADQEDKHQEDQDTEDNKDESETEEASKEKKRLSEDYSDMIEKIVEERLSRMKSNVDKAYKKADELARENTRLKEQEQNQKRKRLEDEGKHLEVANLKLSEFEEKNSILQEQLTSLTRDRELDKHLSGLEFRNEFARETAFKTIISELVQDEDDRWVHKSGAPISDYIKTFSKDPEKDFLFKPKDNSGAGSSNNKNSGAEKGRPKTLTGLSSEDLLKLAREGKLGTVGY